MKCEYCDYCKYPRTCDDNGGNCKCKLMKYKTIDVSVVGGDTPEWCPLNKQEKVGKSIGKPLTIGELKSLEVGDYVWVVYPHLSDCHNEYIQKDSKSTDDYLANELDFYNVYLIYSNYGKTWFAYKNKEQAEGKDDEIRKQTAKEILRTWKTCAEARGETDRSQGSELWVISELAKRRGVEVDE